MPSSNVSWGIEVGAFAIKALKFERAEGGRVNALDFIVLPHKKVLSTPELDQTDAVRVALGQFANQVDLSGAAVAVSIPGHAALARFAKLPPVEPKKIPDIVKFEAVQQIPFGIDEVEWDYQTFQSPDSPDVEVGIFAVTKEKINERLTVYQDVNVVPDTVTLSPVAVYNAMAYDLQFSETTPGTIILDIGTTSTDLIVAESGRVWVRTFPIGGHHFTEALVNAFKLSYAKAEKLKREAEQSKHARHVFQAMRPVFSDLAQEVQRSIGYYQSMHREANLTRLIGLGSTFMLPGLRKYLRQQVGIEVYRIEGFKQLTMEGPRAAEFATASLNLVTAYGLALQGLGLNTIKANLMPVRIIRDAMWDRKVKWFAAAAGVAVLGCAAMFVRPFLDSQAVAGAPRPKIIQDAVSELNAVKSRASEVTGGGTPDPTAANVLSLLGGRDIYPRLVCDLGDMMQSAEVVAANWSPASASPGVQPVPPAFWLDEFKTTYLPPGAGEPIPADPELAQPAGTEPAPAFSEEGDVKSPACIKIEMKVKTTQPGAREFYIRSIHKWLGENHKRDGVPYLIRRGSFKFGDETVVADAKGTQASTPPTGEVVRAPRGRGGDGIDPGPGGGGGRSQAPEGRSPRDRGYVPEDDEEPSPMLIGASPAQQEAWESQQQKQVDVVLKQIAPLPEKPPVAPPGTKFTPIDIVWYVELLPPAKPTEEAK